MLYDMDDDGLVLPDWLPTLDKGSHEPQYPQLCAMEAAAWLAGEEKSDHPRSVHPVIARYARATNDSLTDQERQDLWPLVLASLGTRAPWRPILWYRLMHYGLVTQLQYPGDVRRVWEEVLKEHARLTRRAPVNPRRVLAAHLNTEPAIDPWRDLVGAGTGNTSVLQ